MKLGDEVQYNKNTIEALKCGDKNAIEVTKGYVVSIDGNDFITADGYCAWVLHHGDEQEVLFNLKYRS